MTALPMVIDLRLVRMQDGRWRIRIGEKVHEMDALTLPAFVHTLVRNIAQPRHFGRSRFEPGRPAS